MSPASSPPVTVPAAAARPSPLPLRATGQGAAHAAANIVRTIAGGPRRPFVYRNFGSLATIGRARTIADLGSVRFSGLPAWLFWLFVHIMQLRGFRNRLVVFVQWAFAFFTYQRSIRLITGEGAVSESRSSSR
jgi:NADH dehydrogenase